MSRSTFLIACICLLATRDLAGQQTHPACGSMPRREGYLRAYAKYFRDDEMADVRGDRIHQISPADAQEVVANVGTCQAVRRAAVRMLRAYEPSWPQIEAGGYDFVVLRYGPYYAILVKYSADPDSGQRPRWIPLLVFEAHGLRYVSTIFV